MADDIELLRRFADEGSEEAFGELVRQRIGFVYATSLRLARGDSFLADDVTQQVFLALAKNARGLAARTSLVGWLYKSTHFLTTKAIRSHSRWHHREMEASAMTNTENESAGRWEEIRPVLDAAMQELGDRDREALLLRFFDNCSYPEIGKQIGASGDSARARADRALEKLRTSLACRGITSTATALAGVLVTQSAVAAPASLAGRVIAGALKGALPASGLPVSAGLLARTKLITLCGALIALELISFDVVRRRIDSESVTTDSQHAAELTTLQGENLRLKQAVAVRAASPAAANSTAPLRYSLVELVNLGLLEGVQIPIQLEQPSVLVASVASPLSLTESEQAALTTAIDGAVRIAADAARQNARVDRDGHMIVIHIEPVPAAKEQFAAALQDVSTVLGEERYSAFAKLGGSSVLRAVFNLYGAASSDLSITKVYNPARWPDTYYDVNWRPIEESAISTANSYRGLPSRESLRARIQAWEALVPEEL